MCPCEKIYKDNTAKGVWASVQEAYWTNRATGENQIRETVAHVAETPAKIVYMIVRTKKGGGMS